MLPSKGGGKRQETRAVQGGAGVPGQNDYRSIPSIAQKPRALVPYAAAVHWPRQPLTTVSVVPSQRAPQISPLFARAGRRSRGVGGLGLVREIVRDALDFAMAGLFAGPYDWMMRGKVDGETRRPWLRLARCALQTKIRRVSGGGRLVCPRSFRWRSAVSERDVAPTAGPRADRIQTSRICRKIPDPTLRTNPGCQEGRNAEEEAGRRKIKRKGKNGRAVLRETKTSMSCRCLRGPGGYMCTSRRSIP